MKLKWEYNCLQDESGVMLSAITISLSWHDEYLSWMEIPQHNYYKKFSVNLPKSYVWAPSVTVWNSAGAHSLLKLKNDSMLILYSTGLVTTKISNILDTECDLRLSRFIADFDAILDKLLFCLSLKNLLVLTYAILLSVTIDGFRVGEGRGANCAITPKLKKLQLKMVFFQKALCLLTIFPKIIKNETFLLKFHQRISKFSQNLQRICVFCPNGEKGTHSFVCLFLKNIRKYPKISTENFRKFLQGFSRIFVFRTTASKINWWFVKFLWIIS